MSKAKLEKESKKIEQQYLQLHKEIQGLIGLLEQKTAEANKLKGKFEAYQEMLGKNINSKPNK